MYLKDYPPNSTTGDNALIMTTSAAALSPCIAVLALFGRKTKHILYISLVIATSATLLANACMSANLGWTPAIYADHPIWYIRYISYIIHSPTVLLCLLGFTNEARALLPPVLIYPIFVLFSFGGAFLSGQQNWGLYFSGIFYLLPLGGFLLKLVPSAGFRDERYRPLYFRGVKYMLFIWTIYTIYWPFSGETHIIPPFFDMVLGGVLDFASGPGLIALLIRWLKQLNSEAVQEMATTETKTEMKAESLV